MPTHTVYLSFWHSHSYFSNLSNLSDVSDVSNVSNVVVIIMSTSFYQITLLWCHQYHNQQHNQLTTINKTVLITVSFILIAIRSVCFILFKRSTITTVLRGKQRKERNPVENIRIMLLIRIIVTLCSFHFNPLVA